jgi:hypothetical protein
MFPLLYLIFHLLLSPFIFDCRLVIATSYLVLRGQSQLVPALALLKIFLNLPGFGRCLSRWLET